MMSIKQIQKELDVFSRKIYKRYGLNAADREDALQESIETILSLNKPFKTEREELNYHKTILLNNVRNILRKRKGFSSLTDDIEETGRERPIDIDIPIKNLSGKIRNLLDQLQSDLKKTPRGVDYFAVTLMIFRVKLSNKIIVSLRKGKTPSEHVSVIVERLVIWKNGEQHLSFKTGFPAIGRIWENLTSKIDAVDETIQPKDINISIQRLSRAPVPKLTPAIWYQWHKRVRKKLISFFTPEQLRETLYPWFLSNKKLINTDDDII